MNERLLWKQGSRFCCQGPKWRHEPRWVFRKISSQLYVVSYLYDMQSNSELGSIFTASEKTISIKGE